MELAFAEPGNDVERRIKDHIEALRGTETDTPVVARRCPLQACILRGVHVVHRAVRMASGLFQRVRTVLSGALLGSALWVLAAALLSYTLRHVGKLAIVYGGFAGAVATLIFLYACAATLIFGAEVNGAIRRRVAHRAATAQGSDGADLPLPCTSGKRGMGAPARPGIAVGRPQENPDP